MSLAYREALGVMEPEALKTMDRALQSEHISVALRAAQDILDRLQISVRKSAHCLVVMSSTLLPTLFSMLRPFAHQPSTAFCSRCVIGRSSRSATRELQVRERCARANSSMHSLRDRKFSKSRFVAGS